MHKISLITVTYNSATTLESTIKSIAEQTAYEEIEYIIIDGNSSDNTVDVIKENEKLINKWISEPDNGIYDAMNKGVKMASGKWIGFLHADDIFANNKVIETLIDLVSNNEYNTVYGNLDYVSANNIDKTIRQWISKPFEKSMLKKGWMPPHPTLYINKEHFSKIGLFNTDYKIAADFDFVLRLFSHPHTASIFNNRLMIKMRVGGASNRSIKNILTKSKEDYLALKRNNIGGAVALIKKNTSKLHQFFKKS
ncbi:glycosyltransferase family 2 protein [Carboxylicivirga sp. N1Y90]|uniref:glycosyltransferase family 2 protein n=1 Tax=Carboxylicivirga fragile TaxID=3417571 RepID=UPI003D3568E2|nr:glycosyltransferase [Marinilabiliaceae bacterium N1Y90]